MAVNAIAYFFEKNIDLDFIYQIKNKNKDSQNIIKINNLKNISKKSLENATIFKVSNGNVERSNN